MAVQRASRILLVLAGMFFLFGWMSLCYCTGEFFIATALCIFPICAGQQFLRTVAILILGASLLSASNVYLKEQQVKGIALQIRLKNDRGHKMEKIA